MDVNEVRGSKVNHLVSKVVHDTSIQNSDQCILNFVCDVHSRLTHSWHFSSDDYLDKLFFFSKRVDPKDASVSRLINKGFYPHKMQQA